MIPFRGVEAARPARTPSQDNSPEEVVAIEGGLSTASAEPEPLIEPAEPANQPVSSDGVSIFASPYKPEFPDRCILCNRPANGRRTKLLLFAADRVLVAVAAVLAPIGLLLLLFSSKAKVKVGLCDYHYAKRLSHQVVSSIAILAGLIAFAIFWFEQSHNPIALAIGFALLASGCVIRFVYGRVVSAKRIDGHVIEIIGASPKYLDSLPHYFVRPPNIPRAD